jgi:Flp pilus assembly protein TadD
VVAFHLSQIFWPLPGRFSLEHHFPISTGFMTPPWTAFAMAAVVLWCGAGLWALLRPRRRVVGFFMLWLPASLAIESTVVPLEMIFEHRMYLASMGLAGLAALGVARLCGSFAAARLPLASACFVAVVLLAVATSARIPVWSDRLALAEESLAHAPRSARAWAAVGKILALESRWEEAEVAARRALDLNGDERYALDVLAVRLMDKGDLVDADRLMSRRMKLGGIDDHVLNSLGELRLKQGRAREAVRYFHRAMAADMAVPAYRWNLALALERAGECRQAREQWLAYIELETVEADVRAVREHLRKNYQNQGGTCAAKDP